MAALDDALSRESPRALLIEGDAGIGKTTVWREGVRRARELGYLILSCAPSGAEVRLSFSALGDLLAGENEILESLPVPQIHALEIALLRREPGPDPPDERAIAQGLLGIFRERASGGPVLVAVDDAQWLDAASAGALEFAIRRLRDERLVVLVAQRPGSGPPLGLGRAEVPLETVELAPLSLGAMQQLLRTQLGLGFRRPTARRIHEVSAGNPFYALELARALQRRGGFPPPSDPLPVPETLAGVVSERLTTLPVAAREALLMVAAAGDMPRSSADLDALGPAVDAGIIELTGDEVGFTHPLVAATVYAEAASGELRRAHRHLAETAATVEERARHLALVTDKPESGVADIVAAAAREAVGRGAPSAAAELFERSLLLTPAADLSEWAARARDASDAYDRAGYPIRAKRLAREAIERLPPGHIRAPLLVWLADSELSTELADGAIAEAEGDATLLAHAWSARSEAMHITDDIPGALEGALMALGEARRSGDRDLVVRALAHVGFLEAARGIGTGCLRLEEARGLEEVSPATLFYGPTTARGIVHFWHDELAEARALLEGQVRSADELGAESMKSQLLERLARVELRASNFDRALALVQEAVDLEEGIGGLDPSGATGGEPKSILLLRALFTRAFIHAYQGDLILARRDAEHSFTLLSDEGFGGIINARHALGLVEMMSGHYDAAARLLESLPEIVAGIGIDEPGLYAFHADELEALVRSGRLEQARGRLDIVERRGRELDRPRELVAASRARGFLAEAEGARDAAIRFFEQSLEIGEQLPVPAARGRTLLELGTTLRRSGRRREARERLGEAFELFDGLGAAGLKGKAEAELGAIAGRRSARDELTPAERRVAELVATGRSTKEVAAELVVSPKTVEGHLSRIYTKLGVRSRAEMAHKLNV